jgi:2'-5' RNA ligase
MATPLFAAHRPALKPQDRARLFIALWPEAPAQAALFAESARFAALGRRIPAAKLHVTLAFLGDTEVARIAQLQQLIADARLRACDVTLDRYGHFAQPRILWASSAAVPQEIIAYQQRLSAALAAGGWRTDQRPFRLHVSLLRDCARPPPAQLQAGLSVAWPLRDVALVRSEFAAGGPSYTVLSRTPAS